MTYFGVLPSGAETALPNPVRIQLHWEENAPADGFSGVFPAERGFGPVTGFRAYGADGQLRFDGIVDRQEESVSSERMLSLTGRSRAALLLDSEALPQTYCMPSLGTIFARHVQPYGFSAFRGSGRMFPGALTVTKGMSEWEAAALFCKTFLKQKPRIEDGVFDASGEIPEGELRFGGSGGLPVSALTVENRYGALLSELAAQPGGQGAYRTVKREEAAEVLGVHRRRCLSAGQDAENVLRAARRKAFAVRIDCPGEVAARLLQRASARELLPDAEGELYVSEIAYRLDFAGETTRFVLRRR